MKNINLRIVYLILTLSLLLSFTVGCSTAATSPGSQNPSSVNNQNATTQTNSDTSAVLKKTVISYAGGTCEAPTFVAFQKGFFKEEGLDVELVKSSFDQLRQGLDAGTIDATMANFAWFKPIEQGLNIKLTGGIHTGCISAVTPKDSGITSIKDLKGKIIGVDAIGGGPQIALSAALRANGIDPTTEVEWKAYPGPQLDEAINKNEIQAYMTWDPFPAQAVKDKGYISLLNIGKDEPFSQSYCCFVGISGIVVSKDPEKAAAITRAFLKAAEWVGKNPGENDAASADCWSGVANWWRDFAGWTENHRHKF